jgi:hypothetical protein
MAGTRLWRIGAVALALAAAPGTASAATLNVDDDRADCPSAGYTSIQAAVNAAQAGDVVAICPGVYEEGPDTVPNGGANAVNITKMITLRGAGADKVTIRPKPALTSLLGTTTTYRNGTGAVIGVNRNGVRTLVDISGVTVEAGTTAVGAAVKFWNSEGSLTASRIRSVAPLSADQGYGVVIASNLAGDRLAVRVAGVELSGYAKAGVVLDSTQQAPAAGVLATTIQGNTITGAGPQPTAAQQGVLATGLVSGSISGNVITANRLDDADPGTTTDDVSSAGVRLVDLDLSPASPTSTNTKLTVTGNNIAGNGYGVINESGAGVDQVTPFTATGNWWGDVAGPSLGLPRTVGDPVNGATPGPAAGSTMAVNYANARTTPITVPTVPGATTDVLPTGEIDAPTGSLVVRPATAYTLRAVADDDFGVKSVAFAAGATALGEDAAAPYAAPIAWTPGAALDGEEVELTATITDSAGQVATRTLTVTVQAPPPPPPPSDDDDDGGTPPPPPVTPAAPPVQPAPTPLAVRPASLSATAKAARKRKLTLTGAVALPAGMACPAGARVRVTIYLGGKWLVREFATVDASCRYRLRLTLPRKAAGRKVRVKTRFEAAGGLLARSGPERTVKVRH